MSNEVVLYDKKDSGVALISLNRPDRLNAITGELTARLKEKIDDACKDDDVENIIRAVREVANTGEIGDGKIFVTELNDVVRIRTGETGEDAIKENNYE